MFDQDSWWVDRTGTPHKISLMSVAYRRNVVRHLQDHAAYFQRGTALRLAIQSAGDAIYGIGTPAGTLARARSVIAAAPRDWLNSTVLMVALRGSLDEH